jgi:hypothetical protein
MLAPHPSPRTRARRSRPGRPGTRACLLALVSLAALGATVAASAPASAKLLAIRLLANAPLPEPAIARTHAAPAMRATAFAPAPARDQDASSRAFVTTDQTDYKPGETVVIFGTGWAAEEVVTLTISEASAAHADTVLTATADEYGNILNKEFSPTEEHRGASFTLTATGQSSGRTATAHFTDGGNVIYSPGGVALTAFSGPGGSTTSTFNVNITMPAGNGNGIQPATQFQPTGANPFTANWAVTSTFTPSGNFNTGNNNNGQSALKTFTVSVTPPANTPPGVYTALLKASAPNSVASNPGTTMQVTVTADNTPPATSLSATDSNGNPYVGNFTNANKVTVTLTAADGTGGSGLGVTRYKIDNAPFQTYGGPFDIAAEGVRVITYFSTDNTGAQETAQFFTVKIDKTAPAVNCGTADGLWHASDVQINCTSADGGGQQKAGLVNASDASFTLTTSVPAGTEDANASTDSRQVCDNAGNCSTAGPVAGNMVDKKAPTVTAGAARADTTPYTSGVWVNQNVIVSYNCTDNGSDVANVDGPTTVSAEGANQSATGNCADNVGNSASATFGGIYIDKTQPTLTFDSYLPAPNAAGWNKMDVSVAYTAADALSGVASANPPGPLVLSAEGAAVTGSVAVTDVAGNSRTFTTNAVKIDKTAPAVNITSPVNSPADAGYFLNQPVAANYGCSDALSGVSTCAGPVASGANIDTSTAGPHAFTVNATDVAGNSASDSRTYRVIYDWSAFLPPINNDGSSVFKLGSTVPVKFRLVNGSAGVAGATHFQLFVAKVSNNVVGTEIEAVTSTPSSVGNLFRYDPTGGIYIYNMGTKGVPWSAGTYQLRVDLGDGVMNRTVLVSLRP